MPVTLESNRILIDTVEVETVKTHVPEVDIDIDIVPAITNSEGDPAFELLTYTHSGGSDNQTEFNLTINCKDCSEKFYLKKLVVLDKNRELNTFKINLNE